MGGDNQEKQVTPERPDEISLIEAIQQVVRTQELLSEMQGRMQSLDRQKSKTRQRVVLKELFEEEEHTRSSVRIVAGEIEKMAKFFSSMTITVNGKMITAEEAVRRMTLLKQDINGFKHLLSNAQIASMGIPKLESNLRAFMEATQNCHDAWQEELIGFILLLDAVKIPDSARDLFMSVWTDRNRIVRIYIKWRASEKRWVPAEGFVVSDERLQQYMEDASTLMRNEGVPDGFEAVIEATTDDQGRTTFRVRSGKKNGNTDTAAPATPGWNTYAGSTGSATDFTPGPGNAP